MSQDLYTASDWAIIRTLREVEVPQAGVVQMDARIMLSRVEGGFDRESLNLSMNRLIERGDIRLSTSTGSRILVSLTDQAPRELPSAVLGLRQRAKSLRPRPAGRSDVSDLVRSFMLGLVGSALVGAIAKSLDLLPCTVRYHLRNLEKKGLVSIDADANWMWIGERPADVEVLTADAPAVVAEVDGVSVCEVREVAAIAVEDRVTSPAPVVMPVEAAPALVIPVRSPKALSSRARIVDALTASLRPLSMLQLSTLTGLRGLRFSDAMMRLALSGKIQPVGSLWRLTPKRTPRPLMVIGVPGDTSWMPPPSVRSPVQMSLFH